MSSTLASIVKQGFLGVVAALVAFATSTLVAGPVAPKPDVPSGWLAKATQELASAEYRFSLQTDGSYAAPNRAHELRVRVSDGGITLAPRVEAEVEPPWMFGLRLVGFGRDGVVDDVRAILPRADGSRAELWRDRLDEAYVNDARGIEQIFTLRRPPREASETSPVILEMAIEGDLSAFVSEDGLGVVFKTASDAAVLRYAELGVTDARGDAVPALLAVRDRALRIFIDDREAVYPITVDPLMTSPAWTADGAVPGGRFGYAVATAGDVNGDSFSDVIVGAHGYSNGQGSEGAAFVYLGSASGLAASPAWSAESNQTNARFGSLVATAGDVNGDGYDDVIVGAPTYNNGKNNEGCAFVWYGSAAGLGANGTPANADWFAKSDQTGAQLGQAAGTAGDVNGDGYDDLVVGAWQYDDGQADEGRAFVWYGSAAGLGANGTPANADWSVASDQANALLGNSVAGAGDVDGDGFADVVVGAYQYDGTVSDEGRVLLYLGSAAGLATSAAWHDDGNASGALWFGTSVGTAGDVNGDGFADLIVGAGGYGDALVYHGSATGLAAAPAWHVSGLGGFGNSVATTGDVNGDGFADVIVGYAQFTNGETREGRAYAYLGSASGVATTPFWTSVETNQAESQYGNSVGAAGDVDGDGFSDVIVGSDLFDGAFLDTGRAYVYRGSADGLALTAGWTREGDLADAQFGASLASAGDVNGDGYGDVIVGAPLFDNGSSGGKAFLYLGSAAGPSIVPSWTAVANQSAAYFGFCVASAGDVNGDGYGDVIVGAPFYSNGQTYEGAAYVYLGSATGLGQNGTPANADWRAEGNQTSAEFGRSVASVGDVNGDGYSDVIIGAPEYSDGQTFEGAAFVYLGSATGLGPNGTPVNADWSAESDKPGARFGRSVAGAGDVNGDGYSDAIVGAPFYDVPLTTAGGRAYVFSGSAAGLSASAGWYAELNSDNAYFGNSVASAGDVNGDGYSDVIVGAYGLTDEHDQEGGAFAWYGSAAGLGATGTQLNSDWSDVAEQDGAVFGWTVASAGDVNGDGYSDVLVGAVHYNNGQADEGRAYAYLGSASGLAFSPGWSIESDQIGAQLGVVAGAGDVNGDGFGDVLAGAQTFTNGEFGEGRAFLYYGGGRDGLDLAAHQARADGTAPIGPLGRADSEGAFRLRALGRAPAGRTTVKLEWEVKPLGVAFNGTGLARGAAFADTQFPDLGHGSAVALDEAVSGLSPSTIYHWRVRAVSTSPFFPHSPWISPPWNARTEADLRTAAGAAPFVSSVSPPDFSENQARGTSAVVTFSEAVNAQTVTASTLRLLDSIGATVAASVTVSASGTSATLDPTAMLDPLTSYTVSVGSGIQDLAGTAAVAFTSRFTTAGSSAGGTPLPNVSDPSTPPPSPANAKTGSSVAGAGDLDSDGVQDFVAGAPGYTVSGNAEAGAAIVYLGNGNVDPAQRQSPDIVFTGVAAHDRAGVSVASNFDFNGDGINDILIGAEQVNRVVYPKDPVAPGKVYLIYFDPTDTTHYPNLANPSLSDTVSLSLVGQPGGIPGVVFTGVALGDQAGFAVAGRGFPGDPMWPPDPMYPGDPMKYAAITIGAPGRSFPVDPIGGRGAAYVIWPPDPVGGLPQDPLSLDRVANGQVNQIGGVVYEGAAPGDHLGFAVTLTGDVTGASGNDIVIAAPYADPFLDAATQTDAGIVYVVGGGSLVPATIDVATIGATVNGTQILGEQAGSLLGYSVASAGIQRVWPGDPFYPGDPLFPGDPWRAHVDLLMGAPLYDVPVTPGLARTTSSTGGIDAGAVFQAAKKLPGGIIEVCAVGGVDPEEDPVAGTKWTGRNAGDQLGYAIAVLGDVNANGTDDYALGAPFTDPNGVTDAGTVYIVDGAAVPATVNGTVDVGTVGSTTDGSQLVGTQTGENAGSSLAGTGDINGGGSPDLVAGAPGKDVASDADAGTVYEVVLDDGDGDGTRNATDCAPGDPLVWSLPSEVVSGAISHDKPSGITTITWFVPLTIGGTPSSIRYDTIRTSNPAFFDTGAICLETDGTDTLSTDAASPASGTAFYYLIRAENACGLGSPGTNAAGAPRNLRSCP